MGYAVFIKDNFGQNSGYRQVDNEVAWFPKQQSYENIFRKVKIDANTMEVMNGEFIKDKDKVYRQGRLLKEIIPDDFRSFNRIYIGNHQIIYTTYDDAKIEHPETFEALDDGDFNFSNTYRESYGRDEEFAYFFTEATETAKAVRIKACHNPKAFEVLKNGYAKDDKNVYWEGVKLKKANPDTFVVLDFGYGKDNKYVYIGDRLINEADSATFKVMSEDCAVDCRNYYKDGFVTEENANLNGGR